MKIFRELGLILNLKKIDPSEVKYSRIDKDRILLEIGDSKVTLIVFNKTESDELQKLGDNDILTNKDNKTLTKELVSA